MSIDSIPECPVSKPHSSLAQNSPHSYLPEIKDFALQSARLAPVMLGILRRKKEDAVKKSRTAKRKPVRNLPAKRLSARTAKTVKGGQNVTNSPGLPTGGQSPMTYAPQKP
jgi:hypothetical protein